MSVQSVEKSQHQRLIHGLVLSGSAVAGQKILISPKGTKTTIKSLAGWPEAPEALVAGMAGSLETVEPMLVERGDVLSDASTPVWWMERVHAHLVSLGSEPLLAGERYTMRLGTQSLRTTLSSLKNEAGLDIALGEHGLAEAHLKIHGLAVANPNCLWNFVLTDDRKTLAAGVINLEKSSNSFARLSAHKSDHITPYLLPINTEMCEERNGHKGGVFWFTGLSGSGKSTLARELQKLLFARGKQVVILDGDNLRSGLNRDLGFSEADRKENIRRAAEVAHLMAESGMIVLTAFITPTEADREAARQAHPENFHQIYIDADISLCEARDQKGLYARARTGEIKDFTGVSAPFEQPVNADLVVDTSLSVQECLEKLLRYIETNTALNTRLN